MMTEIVKGYDHYNSLLKNLKKLVNKKNIYINNIPSNLLVNEKLRKNFQNLDIIKLNFDIFKKIIKNKFRKNFKIKNINILNNFLNENINKNKKIKNYKSFLANIYKQNLIS